MRTRFDADTWWDKSAVFLFYTIPLLYFAALDTCYSTNYNFNEGFDLYKICVLLSIVYQDISGLVHPHDNVAIQ